MKVSSMLVISVTTKLQDRIACQYIFVLNMMVSNSNATSVINNVELRAN